jgi:hypothetical protein
MRPFIQKGLIVTIMILSLILAVGVVNSIAQEKIKMKDKTYWVDTKAETMKIDDIDGHLILISEVKGINVGSGAISVSRSTMDVVNWNGTSVGYSTTTDSDGDSTYAKAQGKVITTLSPQGKPVMIMEGSWSMIKGTGKYAGFQGGGPYKLKVIGPGISVMDWEGELVKK